MAANITLTTLEILFSIIFIQQTYSFKKQQYTYEEEPMRDLFFDRTHAHELNISSKQGGTPGLFKVGRSAKAICLLCEED